MGAADTDWLAGDWVALREGWLQWESRGSMQRRAGGLVEEGYEFVDLGIVKDPFRAAGCKPIGD